MSIELYIFARTNKRTKHLHKFLLYFQNIQKQTLGFGGVWHLRYCRLKRCIFRTCLLSITDSAPQLPLSSFRSISISRGLRRGAGCTGDGQERGKKPEVCLLQVFDDVEMLGALPSKHPPISVRVLDRERSHPLQGDGGDGIQRYECRRIAA